MSQNESYRDYIIVHRPIVGGDLVQSRSGVRMRDSFKAKIILFRRPGSPRPPYHYEFMKNRYGNASNALRYDPAMIILRETGVEPNPDGNSIWINNGRDYRIFRALFPDYIPSYSLHDDK